MAACSSTSPSAKAEKKAGQTAQMVPGPGGVPDEGAVGVQMNTCAADPARLPIATDVRTRLGMADTVTVGQRALGWQAPAAACRAGLAARERWWSV